MTGTGPKDAPETADVDRGVGAQPGGAWPVGTPGGTTTGGTGPGDHPPSGLTAGGKGPGDDPTAGGARRPIGEWAALGLPAVVGTVALLLVIRKGVYASPDSAFYVGTARNLLDGNGLTAPPGSPPLSHFPPLFALVLAAVGWVSGLDPLDAAGVVNALLLGVTALLVAVVVRRRSGSVNVGVAASVAVVASVDLLVYFGSALTEPLFVVLVLGAMISLAAAVEGGRRWGWPLAVALTAGACLTRYVGVALVVAEVAVLLAVGRRQALRRSAMLAGASLAPLAVWLVAAGRGNRPVAAHMFDTDYWVDGVRSLSRWVLPPFVSWPVRGLLAAALAGGVVWMAVARPGRRAEPHPTSDRHEHPLPRGTRAIRSDDAEPHPTSDRHEHPLPGGTRAIRSDGAVPQPTSDRHEHPLPGGTRAICSDGAVPHPTSDRHEHPLPGGTRAIRSHRAGVLGVLLPTFALAYLAVLVADRVLLDATGRLDLRFLAVLHVVALVGLVPWLHRTLTGRARPVVAAIGLTLMGLHGIQSASWVADGFTDASVERRGLTAAAWRDSPVLAAVAELPSDVPVYSNAPEAIFLLTGRSTSLLPAHTDYLSDRRRPSYEGELAVVADRLVHKDGVVVWFRPYAFRQRFLASPADLGLHLNAVPVLEDEVATLSRPSR